MCKHGQSLIFDVFIQNAFNLKVSWGHTLIHFVTESLEISSKCFKVAETILVFFVTLGSDERLDKGGLVKFHTRPFRPNRSYKFFKSSYPRPLPAVFSAMLCFIGLSAWPGLYGFPRKDRSLWWRFSRYFRSSAASLTEITGLLFTSISSEKASLDESKILRRAITSSRASWASKVVWNKCS